MKYLVIAAAITLLAAQGTGVAMDNGMHTYVYYYFMDGTPEAIGKAVPGHIQYWESLRLREFQGGPFGDRSGGMIVFQASDMQSAKRIVADDPFVVQEVIGQSWLKQWLVH